MPDMRYSRSVRGVGAGRVLEPEVMDESDDVEAYLDGVATAHLNRMDDHFVAQAIERLPSDRSRRTPRVLDVGTGTGAIPVKIARRHARAQIVGVDRSAGMLRQARRAAREARMQDRVTFHRASGRRLPFPDDSFDLVISNSLMHHLPDPAPVLDEIARVVKPRGRIFIRDLRRPAPPVIDRHIAHHGRHYRGRMFELFSDSVRAAFTESELSAITRASKLSPRLTTGTLQVKRQGRTYLVIETPL